MVLLPQQQLLYSTVFGNDFSAWQNLSSFSVYNLVWLLTGLIVFMLGGIRPLNFYCSDDLMQGSSNGFNLGAVLRTRADNWVLSARFCASGNWLQSFFLISSYAVSLAIHVIEPLTPHLLVSNAKLNLLLKESPKVQGMCQILTIYIKWLKPISLVIIAFLHR